MTGDIGDIDKKIKLHEQWVRSAGEQGQQLVLQKSEFKRVDWAHRMLIEAELAGSNFDGSSFVDANLASSNLAEASLVGCNLRNARIAKASFDHANLQEADFIGTFALRATFVEANAKGANFTGSLLTRAIFNGAKLGGVCFSATYIDGVAVDDKTTLAGATGFDTASVISLFIHRPDGSEKLEHEGAKAWLLERANARGDS